MAGGLGSRYGGLKQVDSFGPNNESLLDYSIYDALKAGFNQIVILIHVDVFPFPPRTPQVVCREFNFVCRFLLVC